MEDRKIVYALIATEVSLLSLCPHPYYDMIGLYKKEENAKKHWRKKKRELKLKFDINKDSFFGKLGETRTYDEGENYWEATLNYLGEPIRTNKLEIVKFTIND